MLSIWIGYMGGRKLWFLSCVRNERIFKGIYYKKKFLVLYVVIIYLVKNESGWILCSLL